MSDISTTVKALTLIAKEPALSAIVAAVLGACVGLAGGEVLRWWRDRREIKRIKQEIINDLKIVQKQLPALRDLITGAREFVGKNKVTPLRYISFPVHGFKAHFSKIYFHYSMEERVCLQSIFSELSSSEYLINNILEKTEQMVKISLLGTKYPDWKDAYLTLLLGLETSINNIEATLDPLLKGDLETAYAALSG